MGISLSFYSLILKNLNKNKVKYIRLSKRKVETDDFDTPFFVSMILFKAEVADQRIKNLKYSFVVCLPFIPRDVLFLERKVILM